VTALELLGRARGTLEAARPGAARAARWAWEHRTVVLAIAVVLLLALNVRACRRAGDAEGRAAAAEKRGAGEVAAAAAGVPVVHEAPQATVDAEAERARRENPLLAARLARAERELGKLRLELVARARAAPTPVTAVPRPPVADSAPRLRAENRQRRGRPSFSPATSSASRPTLPSRGRPRARMSSRARSPPGASSTASCSSGSRSRRR
jgi:hypothetical protein